MPTILRFGAFRIMIYTDDHEPAHVHVSGKGGLVISYLDAQSRLISVRDNRNVSKRDVRSIADFLVGNLDICLQRGSNYMVSDAEYKAATRRGREMRKHVPHAISAHYDERLQRVLVRLSNRLELALNPADHQTLHNATAEQLSDIELWGAGYELFFPKLDDGVYVPSLIQGILGSKKWMEEQAAKERKEFAAQRKTLVRKQARAIAA